MTLPRLLLMTCAAGLVLTGVAGADGAPLRGTVGPGFTISLQDGSGAVVKQLDPGTYALTVDDLSEEHNFHLQGPGGVDVSTGIDEVGVKAFSVALVDGTYTFFCDPHPTRMMGTFSVGTPAPTPATPAPTRLLLTVTARAAALTTPAGMPVRALAAGPAVITVRDRSAARGARLVGAGVSRSTTARFIGTVTWRVKLSAGTLVYGSDTRKPVLRGGRVPVS